MADWLTNNEFSSWSQKIEGNVHCAKCRVCSKTISVFGQGIKALKSHAKKVKHREYLLKPGGSTISFPSSIKTSQPVETSALKQTYIVDVNANQLATKAEIMWSINLFLSNYSFNSVSNRSDIFCKMFSNSKIAENFSCGKTKCSYVVCVGLASYFKELLTKSLKDVEQIVALFDASFNKTSKLGQMDMHVWYWDNNHNYITIRYYHSEFMGKTSAKDVFESFSACLSGICQSKLLQVSFDGPDLNVSFLGILEEDRNEKELSKLVHIGTCDLHTLHNSMKQGEKASGSNVKKLLSSLHIIFDESPSRRPDCETHTQAISSDYPLQFCAYSWV